MGFHPNGRLDVSVRCRSRWRAVIALCRCVSRSQRAIGGQTHSVWVIAFVDDPVHSPDH